MATIYVYSPDGIKLMQIGGVAMSLQIGFKQLCPKDLNKKVGELTGFPMGSKNIADPGVTGPVPVFYNMPEIMLLSGLAGDLLDRFLAACNMAGGASIALKSVVTPYNAPWTLYQLIEHVKKEAESV